MPRDGYQSIKITLTDDVVEALDSMGSSRSGVISRLILSQKQILDKTGDVFDSDSPEALTSYIKKKLPEFSRQEAANLIIVVALHLS
jgi:predicted CopG family antitoxin